MRSFPRIKKTLAVALLPFRWLARIFLWMLASVWDFVVFVLRRIAAAILWPFRARGVPRERFFLVVVTIAAIVSAFVAYPQGWDRAAEALKPHYDAAVAKLPPSYGKMILEKLSPREFPKTFWGRNLGEYVLGLDLVGGAHLEYRADTSKLASRDTADALAALRDTIERRVNIFGVREPIVQLAKAGGENRLIVELSGITDVKAAVDRVGNPIFLEFREERPKEEIPSVGPTGEPLELSPAQLQDPNFLFKPTDLTGQYLKRADVTFDPTTNMPQIQLTFTDEGKEKFRELTARNVGKRLAIFLDGYPVTAPTVREEISGGTAVITGQFTLEEARALSRNLNAGALPVPITLVAQRTVGATLGQKSLEEMIRAGVATMMLIAAFMVLLYRLPGFLALVALAFYSAFVLALFKLIPVTLTLSGIAGFILSVGMAVDANILIFARMREERRQGRELVAAIDEGFRRAWLAIRDSNVSTMLTTVILYTVGTSFVQGFALALGVGVLTSMFTAVFVSRQFLREAVRHRSLTRFRFLW
jgi:protein-export membrane protein SecD